MAFGPINRLGMSERVDVAADNSSAAERQIIAAIHGLNQSALFAQNRELTYRRNPKTGRLVIQLVERDSREVLNEIAPQAVVDFVNDFREERNSGESEW
jgi:uncharacterized FlaG/YvyC family protein